MDYPNGLSVGLSLGTTQILLGKTGISVLSIVGHKIGNYTLAVTAASGAIAPFANLAVRATNLTMTSNPSFITVARGSRATPTISLTTGNGLDSELHARSGAARLTS